MREATAELLIEAAEMAGLEMEARADYSGRGMYGRTTVAVSFEDYGALLYAVAQASYDLGAWVESDACDEMLERAETFMQDVRTLRFDQLGKGLVAY